MKVKKAIIPAAGLGTRVLPASKAVPKELLPIVDKPALKYIVEEIASLRGDSAENIARMSLENAKRLFKIC